MGNGRITFSLVLGVAIIGCNFAAIRLIHSGGWNAATVQVHLG
jgi:hypothetical protein